MSSNPPLSYPSTFSPSIRVLLDRLHNASSTQESQIDPSVRKQIRALFKTDPKESMKLEDDQMRDKFIALDKDKSLLVYNLILASGATSIVEIGTSFGVSTIYLALAAAANAQGKGIKPKVIATEKEETKADIAKKHWSEAGNAVEDVIDLRVGNLLETLKENVEEVHFVLLDIWAYVALPALKLLLPRMRDGAVVVTDNTIKSAVDYTDLLKMLREDEQFQSVTLPYTGGLEFSVYKRRPA